MAHKSIEEWYWQFGAEIQEFGDELLRSSFSTSTKPFWEPKVDLFESETHLIVRAELAGMKAENLRVLYSAERHSITIRGRRTDEWGNTHGVACHQLEIYFGDFEREVRLPEMLVVSSGLQASYRNGLLLVSLPKL
jgi:HSP20 family protein